MARINFFQFFQILLERFGNFAVPISTEYHSFLSHLMRSATDHRIGEMVLNNHCVVTLYYSNIPCLLCVLPDISNDLLISRREISNQMRRNSIQCYESKIPADRNSREKTTRRAEVQRWSV